MKKSSGDRKNNRIIAYRRFGALILLGLPGILATLIMGLLTAPERYAVPAEEAELPVIAFALIGVVFSLTLLALHVFLGLLTAPRVGFRSHLVDTVSTPGNSLSAVFSRMKRGLPHALAVGAAVGVLLLALERVAPTPLEPLPDPTIVLLLQSLPVRILYGGVTEELLLRWGIMSVVTFGLWKILARKTEKPSPAIVWSAIIVSALLFGAGHLPAAQSVYGSLTGEVLLFIIGGNALAGIGFGWLFSRYTLESAMVAHASAHVFAVAGSILAILVA